MVMNKKLKEVLITYNKQALALTPLRDKKPFLQGWQHTKPEDFNIENFNKSESAGVIIPEWMLVIDVDVHKGKFGKESLEKMSKDFGFDFLNNAGIVVKTASGGYHLYYKIPAEIIGSEIINELKTHYPSVEFKSIGRQVVIPGSRLSDGRSYSYDILRNKGWDKIIEAPLEFFKVITGKSKPKSLSENNFGKIHNHPADIISFQGYLANHEEVVEGDRNNTAFIFAAEGKERALSEETIFTCIVESSP